MDKDLSWSEVGVLKIPLHGKHGIGKVALVDGDYDGEYLSSFRWHLNDNGYVIRKSTLSFDGFNGINIYLHREVCRPLGGHWVDHINRNKLDNRTINLRSVPPSVNARNRSQSPVARSKPGFRGVAISSPGRFRLRFKGEYLGVFGSEVEAAEAYDALASKLYGRDAVLNFPKDH